MKMNKKEMRKGGSGLMLIGILAIALAIAGVVVGIGGGEEILQIEGELVDSGYGWLVNYSVGYPSVEVFVEGGNLSLARFDNISEESLMKIYLSELNGSEDVFDLYVSGSGVEFDWVVDPTLGNVTCDAGDNLTTCNISTLHYVEDGSVLNYNNVNILSGGSLVNDTANCSGSSHGCGFRLVLSGNLTVYSGGNITAGNVSVTAANVDVQSGGSIVSDGLGWMTYSGPGYAANTIGASHGGFGFGATGKASAWNYIYGNASAPVTMGTGSSSYVGGGVIFINATDNLTVDGIVRSKGDGSFVSTYGSAGGSVWLISDILKGSGTINADAGDINNAYGGGGRIRTTYTTTSFNGTVSAVGIRASSVPTASGGTYSFTDGASVNLTVKGSFALAGGNYTLNTLNVSSGRTLYVQPVNATASDSGQGVVINAANVYVEAGARISGDDLGFQSGKGPGYQSSRAGSHAGFGISVTDNTKLYGSATEPLSLGSGGHWNTLYSPGGGAVRINATGEVIVDGNITMKGGGSGANYCGAGGSVWLMGGNLTIGGYIFANGGVCTNTAGGSGWIALYASDALVLNGTVDNDGSSRTDGTVFASAGGVYINGTNSITSSGNVTATGYNGTTAKVNFSGGLLSLSGVYNASGVVENGTIGVSGTNCNSLLSGTFAPAYDDLSSGCDGVLVLTDDSDSATTYANYTKFYANYTAGGSAVSVGTSYCEFLQNKSGNWKSVGNMSYNVTSTFYEFTGDCGYTAGRGCVPVGNYSWNASCSSNTLAGSVNDSNLVGISNYSASMVVSGNGSVSSTGIRLSANYTRDGGFGVDGIGPELGRVVWNLTIPGAPGNLGRNVIQALDLENLGKMSGFSIEYYSGSSTNYYWGGYRNGTQKFLSQINTWDILFQHDIGDFDNDGYKDDAVITQDPGNLLVRNETDATIWAQGGADTSYSNVITGDFNADGIDDFAALNGTGICIYTNDGDGTSFTLVGCGGSGGSSGAEMHIGDLDRDGVEDDIVSSKQILTSTNEDGETIWSVDYSFTYAYNGAMAVLDLDSDGYRDEVVLGELGDILVWEYNGTMNASYGTADAIDTNGEVVNYVTEIVGADLDNDGYTDEILVGEDNYLWAFDENLDQMWNYSKDFFGNPGAILSVDVIDLDGDSEDEIIIGGEDGLLMVLNRTGGLIWEHNLTFAINYDQANSYSSSFGSNPATAMADIDDDGLMDMFVFTDEQVFGMRDADCSVTFNDSINYDMDWNVTSGVWEMNETKVGEGTFAYNLSCEKGGYESEVYSSSVMIDTVAPVVGYVSPTYGNDSYVNSGSVYVNLSVVEANPLNVTFGLYDSDGGLVSSQAYVVGGVAAGGIPSGVNLLNNSYGTFEGIAGTSGTADNLVDSMFYTAWRAGYNQVTNQNITINLSASYSFDTIEIFKTPYSGLRNANHTRIYISDDFSDWTLIWDGNLFEDRPPASLAYVYDHETITSSQNARYLKFEILDNWDDEHYLELGDIRVYTAGTNLANSSSTTVTTENDLTGVAANLVDNNYTTEWRPNPIQYTNITFNFSEAKAIDSIEMSGRGYYTGQQGFPEFFTLMTSGDGSSWSVMENFTSAGGMAGYTERFNFSKVDTQYLRIMLNHTSSGYLWLSQVRIWEYSNPAYQTYHNFTGLSDGSYYFNATVFDQVGGSGSNVTRKVTIDATAPSAGYVPPTLANNSFVNQDYVYVNVSVVEANTVNVTFGLFNGSGVVNSTTFNMADQNSNVSINWTGLVDGEYEYNVTVVDGAGGSNSTVTRMVTLDTAFPAVEFLSPTLSDGSYTNATSVYVNVSASDTNKDVVLLQWGNSSGLFNESFASSSGDVYWSNKTGLAEGYYNFTAFVNDSAGNLNSTGMRVVLVDVAYPAIDYGLNTPADLSYTNGSNLFVNVSVTETNFANITFTLYNSSGEVNTTTYSSAAYSINWSVANDGIYTYNVTIVDLALKSNSTASRNLTRDSVAPQVVLNTVGMPANNSVGASSVFFNWTASDNINGFISCFALSSVDGEMTFNNVTNGTTDDSTETLSGGTHLLRVRCNDSAGNVNTTLNSISYLVAVINVSAPVNNLTYRVGENVTFFVEELDGTDYLTNVTIPIIRAGSVFVTAFPSEVSTNNWSVNYTMPDIAPVYLLARAQAFNQSVGAAQNVTQERGLILLRAAGNTSAPTMTEVCPNRTYVVNGTDVLIETIVDLDTLVLNATLNLTSPSNVSYVLSADALSGPTDVTYIYSKNYTFAVNETGTYSVNYTVEDYENQVVTRSYDFYSVVGSNTYRINSSTVTNITVVDKCSGATVNKSDDLTVEVPTGAVFDLDVELNDPLVNLSDISLVMRDVNLSGDVNEAIYFDKLNSTYEALMESERIVIGLYQINSSLNFSNYTFIYDYSLIASLIGNESGISLYKCSALDNSTCVDSGASADVEEDTINATFTNFSYFLVKGALISPESVTVTVSVPTGGGGSSTKVVYRSLNIIVPGQVEMSLADEVVVPIRVENPEDIDMVTIHLNATPNTEDLSPVWQTDVIDELKAGENTTVMLYLESHSSPGEYDVDLMATVTTPNIEESAKLYVRLVEAIGKETLIERVVLAQDMFRENPQCLELNDLLDEAQRKIDAGDVEGGKEAVKAAIDGCRDLISGTEFPLGLKSLQEWKNPILVAMGLIIIAGIIAFVLYRPKLDLYKKRGAKKKRGFWSRLFSKKK